MPASAPAIQLIVAIPPGRQCRTQPTTDPLIPTVVEANFLPCPFTTTIQMPSALVLRPSGDAVPTMQVLSVANLGNIHLTKKTAETIITLGECRGQTTSFILSLLHLLQ